VTVSMTFWRIGHPAIRRDVYGRRLPIAAAEIAQIVVSDINLIRWPGPNPRLVETRRRVEIVEVIVEAGAVGARKGLDLIIADADAVERRSQRGRSIERDRLVEGLKTAKARPSRAAVVADPIGCGDVGRRRAEHGGESAGDQLVRVVRVHPNAGFRVLLRFRARRIRDDVDQSDRARAHTARDGKAGYHGCRAEQPVRSAHCDLPVNLLHSGQFSCQKLTY
jgi:hypothetical protein